MISLELACLILLITFFDATSIAIREDCYVRRIEDADLYYAAESRNYPEDPNTLFVTMRGGGIKVFDITERAELKAISQWVTSRPVEGQDRSGDLMIVAELGRG